MRNLFAPINRWLQKEPSENTSSTEDIDQALEELHDLSKRQLEVINEVRQPDLLRSLVISMNTGKNQ